MKIGEHQRKLIEDSVQAFSNRTSLDSFWQEVAYQFYPEMAEFTIDRYLGDEFADHLTTSYPLLVRRTLGDNIGAMLRPTSLDTMQPGVWFGVRAMQEQIEGTEELRWLEHHSGVMRRAMYDKDTGFVRACKEADHSFVTFGQAPISLNLNRARDTLIYRCHHLRDVAWRENSAGRISTVYRRHCPSYNQAKHEFGDKISPAAKEKLEKDPHGTVNLLHIVVAREEYEDRSAKGKKFKRPWVSIWLDTDNEWIISESDSNSRIYIIPRWVTIPGTQYASSPAVTAGLPDARLIQAMTLTVLESGEKLADPPLIAVQEAMRGDQNVMAGGTTYVDAEYDERLGEVLRPLYEPRAGQGMQVALELRREIQESLGKAFFLDSLRLPPAGVKEMTAFEVGERISEWIRSAMPLFEPMIFDYNAEICEETWNLLMRNGAFGSVDEWPQRLRGADLQFKFESPLHAGIERKKGQKFLEAKAALVQAAELDQGVVPMLNATDALRDVLAGIGVPSKWTLSEREMAAKQAEQQEEQNAMEAIQGGAAGAEIAQKLGSAAKDFAAAGAPQ